MANTVKERVMKLVSRQMEQTYPSESYKYELQLKRLPRMLDDVPPRMIESVAFTGRGLPRGYETIDVYYRQGDSKRVAKSQVQVVVWQYLPVAGTRFESGEEITPERLTWQWIDITRLSGAFITVPKEAIGLVAGKLIRQGDPIRETDLTRPPIVEPGANISMHYRSNGLDIAITCTARKAAAKGDEIRLYSEQTRKTYLARITATNTAVWLKTL